MVRGAVKTTAILVATRDKTEVYRTIQDMPFPLRRRIVRLASGPAAVGRASLAGAGGLRPVDASALVVGAARLRSTP
jgi:hypothetical protein